MVANIDIAPTILAMAGLGEDAGMDGQSIMGIFDNEENGGEWNRETILIERGFERGGRRRVHRMMIWEITEKCQKCVESGIG
jgi:arylsulfatase A-like enzyme